MITNGAENVAENNQPVHLDSAIKLPHYFKNGEEGASEWIMGAEEGAHYGRQIAKQIADGGIINGILDDQHYHPRKSEIALLPPDIQRRLQAVRDLKSGDLLSLCDEGLSEGFAQAFTAEMITIDEDAFSRSWSETVRESRDLTDDLVALIAGSGNQVETLEGLVARDCSLIDEASVQVSRWHCLQTIKTHGMLCDFGYGGNIYDYAAQPSKYCNQQIVDISNHFAALAKIRDIYKIELIDKALANITMRFDLREFNLGDNLIERKNKTEVGADDIEAEAERRLVADGLTNYLEQHKDDPRAQMMVFASFASSFLLPAEAARADYIGELTHSVQNHRASALFDLPWNKPDIDFLLDKADREKTSILEHKPANTPSGFFLDIIIRRGNTNTLREVLARVVGMIKSFGVQSIKMRGQSKDDYKRDDPGSNLVAAHKSLLARGDDDLANELIVVPLIGKHKSLEAAVADQTLGAQPVLEEIFRLRVDYLRTNLMSPEYQTYLTKQYREWLGANWKFTIATVEANALEYTSRVLDVFRARVSEKGEWETKGLTDNEMRQVDAEFIAQKEELLNV